MKSNTIILLITILLLVIRCELPQELKLKTSKNPDVSITIYADASFSHRGEARSGKKITLSLPSKRQTTIRDTSIFFGVGGWNDDKISELANNIDSIVIKNTSTTINVGNTADIINFLKKHYISGWNSKILIEAD